MFPRIATSAALAVFLATCPESAFARHISRHEHRDAAAEAIVETANAEKSDPQAEKEAEKRKLQDAEAERKLQDASVSLSVDQALIGGGGWGYGGWWQNQPMPWWAQGGGMWGNSKSSKGGYGGGYGGGDWHGSKSSKADHGSKSGGSKGSKSGDMEEHCNIEALNGLMFVGDVGFWDNLGEDGFQDEVARITLSFDKPSGMGNGVMEMKYCHVQGHYENEQGCYRGTANPRFEDMVAVAAGFPQNGILPIHVAPGGGIVGYGTEDCNRRRVVDAEEGGVADRVLEEKGEGGEAEAASSSPSTYAQSLRGEFNCATGELAIGMTYYFEARAWSTRMKPANGLITDDFLDELGYGFSGDYCYAGPLPGKWGAPPAWAAPPTAPAHGGWGGW